MNIKVIKTTVKGKFVIKDKIIDFNPVIIANNLEGIFVLSHWNKIAGLPGYYDSYSGDYFLKQCIKTDLLSLPHKYIDCEENVLPSCVIYYPDYRMSS